MAVHLFGIRHHGPGCARSLRAALHSLEPDCILIEGPPEADDLLPLVSSLEMQTPVAVLVYAPALPHHAVYYPFAQFSPEWQAILYGQAHATPTRFIDLPQAIQLAREMSIDASPESADASDASDASGVPDEPEPVNDSAKPYAALRTDPLTYLAQASGFSDSDTWWDHLIEQREDALDLFSAIEEMMTVARADDKGDLAPREALREAHMRQAIRQAQKSGYEKIAVVCGAWHVPALRNMPSAKSDADVLKNQAKARVAATWTPWTFGRLSQASGYGAGIAAPGWYHHCWNQGPKAASFWLADAMRLLRDKDLDASSAHMIEILRLADTLASLRDRTRPGLKELLEAMQSVMFAGDAIPMRLIEKDLLISDRMGSIPSDTPSLPLPLDVKDQQRRLRLPSKIEHIDIDLDLRQPAHLEKSILIHRLRLLDIEWGKTRHVTGKTGSFHEHWRLAWDVEYELKLIEANVWGTDLAQACDAKLRHYARHSQQLPELTALVQSMLLADIKSAVPAVMDAIQELSASIKDAGILLAALPPLANILRYGDTRGTDLSMVHAVFVGLVQRACLALPQASSGINLDAAQGLLKQINGADQALRLLEIQELLSLWTATLLQCSHSTQHPLIAGRAIRLLIDHAVLEDEKAADALSLACSNPINPNASAEWLEGFLQGSGLLLVMNERLWQILSDWVANLPEAVFSELLPLLRRSFSHYEVGEKRQLGQRVGTGQFSVRAKLGPSIELHTPRASRVLEIARKILID